MAERRENRAGIYVEGNAVRKLAEQPQPMPEESTRQVSRMIRRNRERALQMNFAYVLFLTAAAVIMVFVCVNFLQLRAKGTLLQEEVASLEAELDSAILENDSEYNRVMNSIDLGYVQEVAAGELGMKKASSKQVVTYDLKGGDYVRQYREIPAD